MIIDCDRCTVRGAACAGCAVTSVTGQGPVRAPILAADASRVAPASGPRAVPARPSARKPRDQIATGKPPEGAGSSLVIELDAAELRALAALANAGMIPPLRYAPPMAKAS